MGVGDFKQLQFFTASENLELKDVSYWVLDKVIASLFPDASFVIESRKIPYVLMTQKMTLSHMLSKSSLQEKPLDPITPL
ncbi:hypothetical protein CEXT_511371 [Caerostris extrusa]|uniref:Uncharacterized protein n=1 Tax=Caerostris extrusa TaxID=172846 RepID=A0AAV4Y791_CAEEX|nr:hypothetical protein CEXT_511371 [Caerostris extrusa]